MKSTELQGNVAGYFKGFYVIYFYWNLIYELLFLKDKNKWVEFRIVNKAGHFVPYY